MKLPVSPPVAPAGGLAPAAALKVRPVLMASVPRSATAARPAASTVSRALPSASTKLMSPAAKAASSLILVFPTYKATFAPSDLMVTSPSAVTPAFAAAARIASLSAALKFTVLKLSSSRPGVICSPVLTAVSKAVAAMALVPLSAKVTLPRSVPATGFAPSKAAKL